MAAYQYDRRDGTRFLAVGKGRTWRLYVRDEAGQAQPVQPVTTYPSRRAAVEAGMSQMAQVETCDNAGTLAP